MKKPITRFRKSGRVDIAAGICAGVLIAVVAVLVLKVPAGELRPLRSAQAAAIQPAPPLRAKSAAPRFADMRGEQAADDVKFMADWVADSRDAGGKPFVIIDKKGARVYVLDRQARLLGASPVLLGSARGDHTVPGIGDRPLSQVRPAERTTPAGRFVGERGHNARGEDVVWIDYDAAVSMHRVLTTKPKERRVERLATPTVDDNRISFGCVNVPVAFYEQFVRPAFADHTAMIYVLPETRSVQQEFGAYDVAAFHGQRQKQVQRVPDSNVLMILLHALRSN